MCQWEGEEGVGVLGQGGTAPAEVMQGQVNGRHPPLQLNAGLQI